ncbi:helix-turn-helix domain-containing protein [Roseinatronobacter sp. S2]|uniref:helix-turn-helix domain-containing protein n=1 Tax=Roseinatronobacter sp. S2 TaxID=3035471 RepID=UPI002410182C|nr:helix-turn-helix domain-containing protein [Roseinatronobacter sp. S2]WFE73310.1 helix-turn-helix domain-containing protein [Roseinatronobacter sp. S2]
MRHHRKLTDEERRQIIEARGEGIPAVELARRFGVTPRTIYNTLNRAKAPRAARPARTKTVTMRVSDRDLTGFMTALAGRGITDRPAAMRRLIGTADKILMGPDPAMVARLNGWTAEIQTRGAAINQIARKLNEAKLRGHPLPYTDKDEAVMRAMMGLMVTFTTDFRALWGAKLEAMSQEVDEALSGLEAKRLGVQ